MKSQFCVKALVVLFTIDEEGDDDTAALEGNREDEDDEEFGSIVCGLFAFAVLEKEMEERGSC